MIITILLLIYIVSAIGAREYIKWKHVNEWKHINTGVGDIFFVVIPIFNTVVAIHGLIHLVARKYRFNTNKFFGLEDRE